MNKCEYFLREALHSEIKKTLLTYEVENIVERIFKKDPTVWKKDPVLDVELSDRLGWLQLPAENLLKTKDWAEFADEVKTDFDTILLLGMGGSSLAPEVFAKTYGSKNKFPELRILDSTHPAVVKDIMDEFDLSRTLFIVASKSGGTAETMSFFHTMYEHVSQTNPLPGMQFIALTDPGSGLERMARETGFRKVYNTPPEVGGRYSALTEFGMVPASLMGMDVQKFLKFAEEMQKRCSPGVPVMDNPGVVLGVSLAEAAISGTDKVTFLCSPEIASFPQWIEQLIAESTGKEEKGILPIADEIYTEAALYGFDTLFAVLRLESGENEALDKQVAELRKLGHQVLVIHVGDLYALSQEFYRWEMATAIAGAVLGINPFDQPNVQLAKTLANESLAAFKKLGKLPVTTPQFVENGIEVYGGNHKSLKELLNALCTDRKEGEFFSILAFIPYGKGIEEQMQILRKSIQQKSHRLVTHGYGPRFLHSTGQLHKGGQNTGNFIQITAAIEHDIDVPAQGYSFGVLVSAQAQGDFKALQSKGRNAIRLHFLGDVEDSLKYIVAAMK